MNKFRANTLRLLSMLIIPMLIIVGFSESAAAQQSVKKGLRNVNGTSLYYEVKGKGFPLVLISGGGLMDSRAWDEQFENFSKHFKVIRYDIRGIGKSARPQQTFSHSQDLYALLKSLKVRKAHLIGLSFGGGLALDFALDHPDMVDHTILAASGTSTDAKGEANLQGLAWLSSVAKKDGIAKMSQLVSETPTFIAKDNLAAQEKIRQNYFDNRDIFESDFPLVSLWQPTKPAAANRLGGIRGPVLIMMAENDIPAYKEITEKLAKGLGSARKIVIPGAAHAVNLDKPKEFDDAVLAFLRKKSLRDRTRARD